MTVHLALVSSQSETADARAARIDRLQVNRSCYRGSAGTEALRKLKPLAPDEQACADRCAERTAAAKDAIVPLPVILRTFAAAPVIRRTT